MRQKTSLLYFHKNHRLILWSYNYFNYLLFSLTALSLELECAKQ